MSNSTDAPQGTELPLLWNYERTMYGLVEHLDGDGQTARRVITFISDVLYDYESERANLTAQLAAKEERIVQLEVQLAEAKKWVPSLEIQSGVLDFVRPLIETANAPGEDEVWAHLQEDKDE